jgi:hypothetical protein
MRSLKSRRWYGAIKEKLVGAGYEHAIDLNGIIDLHGLGLKEND